MLSGKESRQELVAWRHFLYADLLKNCGNMDVRSMESACRKLHVLDIKLQSFKGGIYDRKEERY